jgi:hypothetical protein
VTEEGRGLVAEQGDPVLSDPAEFAVCDVVRHDSIVPAKEG